MTTRYESRGGAHYIEWGEPNEYGLVNYQTNDGGGYARVEDLEARIAEGIYQPDANVTPMRKVRG